MNELKRIPISETPDWVKAIVWAEEVLPEELAKAKVDGNKVYRAIRAEQGNFLICFLICFDQETGEATDIVWL